MEKSFSQAEQLFLARQYPEAENAYRQYLKQFSYNYFAPQANYRLAEIQLVAKKWNEAIPYYRASLKKGVLPEWGAKAIYQMAICYFRLNDFKNSFYVLDQLPRDTDPSLKVRGGSLRVTSAKKGKDPVQEIIGYLELVEAYSQIPPQDRESGDLTWVVEDREALKAVREWTEKSPGPGEDLKKLLRRFSGQTSGGYLLWKAIRMHHQQGNYDKSSSLAQRFLREYPKHEYITSARLLLSELGKRASGSRATVGVLLPLTGKYGVYGESVLHGLECAAGIFRPCGGDLGIVLEIRDTGSDPEGAARELRQLAAQPEVMAVIGPLSQEEAEAVAPIADELQIPVIVLSQKPGIAAKGNFVFRNFLTVADQVATLVDFTCRDKKLKEFAILYPQSSGGEEYRSRFEEEVKNCGSELVAQESYPIGTENFLEPVRALKHAKGKYTAKESRPFDALFFPDIYLHLPDLIEALRFLGMRGVLLMGGPGWDHPDLASLKPEGISETVFVNGFFPRSGSFTTKDFVASYQKTYEIEPTLLEAYGYDSLRLLGAVLRGPVASTRPQVQESLASMAHFRGVTGEISFDSEGDARRRLFLLTVKDGEIRELR